MPCKYHDFMQTRETDEVIIEVCKLCKVREVWRKKEGRIDNVSYLKAHVRSFCQSTGPTAKIFEEIYGPAARKRSLKAKTAQISQGDKIQEGAEQMKETLRLWKKLEGKGFSDKEIRQAVARL